MRKKGSSQLLPTPQTSTTSSSWDKDEEIFLSSELEVEIDNYNTFKGAKQGKKWFLLKPPVLKKRPRLLRGCKSNADSSGTQSRSKSSWPFRSSDKYLEITNLHDWESAKFTENGNGDNLRLKLALERDFPYKRAIEKLSMNSKSILFDRRIWEFILKVSTIYAGDDPTGDLQKRNEIALASWTTLLRVYAKCRIRGGVNQLEKLAVSAVILQAKLLEESDVDIRKLLRKVGKMTSTVMEKEKIEGEERKICCLLNWKLLIPSPQVILFLALDELSDSISIPKSLKLFVSKVLDKLIEDFFIQQNCEDLMVAGLVRNVLEVVLNDYFSVFQSKKIEIGALLDEIFQCTSSASKVAAGIKERIEMAIEDVVGDCNN